MNQLNNYNLKKVTLILIAVMLLAIPNIHSYSFIGSYQKTSKAITANKKYLCLAANDNITIGNIITIGDITIGSIAIGEMIGDLKGGPPMIPTYFYYYCDGDDLLGGGSKHNPIAEQYSKYDFTGFDN